MENDEDEDNEHEVDIVEGGNEQENNNINEEFDEADFYEEKEDDPGATKTRSKVWKHFIVIRNAAGRKYGKCIHCPNIKYRISGKSNGGTGNLRRHLLRKHPDKFSDETLKQDKPFVFSQDNFRKALLEWVVACDQSYTAPQQEAFIRLVNSLNPDAHTYTDKTIKADELAEYLTKFEELKEEVAKIPGKISITMDGWTSKIFLPFMAIGGHWLDDNWTYQTKLFDFAHIEGGHNGHNHSRIFANCLVRLGIPFPKIMAITLDNATNNDTFFDWLEEHGISADSHQVRCMSHIINLGVQDILSALKVPSVHHDNIDENGDLENEVLEDIDLNAEITDIDFEEDAEVDINDGKVIVKLRKLVLKIRKSVQMRQKLKKFCESYAMKYLVPVIDVQTRWNSTFHMISRAETLKVPLRAFCMNEKNLQGLCINQNEWTELRKIKNLLVNFDRSTKLMSMERRSTNSSYLPTLNWLMEVLTDYTNENSDALAIAANAGILKLKKYEECINSTKLPFICTFLNPALKMNYFKEYYAKNAVKDIHTKISSFFNASYSPPTHNNKRTANESDVDDEFYSHLYKRSKRSNEATEFKNYLDLPLSNPNVDLIEYWKGKQQECPCLSAMARDFLPIQPSSVSVERDFSGAVDVVTPNRCRLQAETIRARMSLKSWLKQ